MPYELGNVLYVARAWNLWLVIIKNFFIENPNTILPDPGIEP